jgi:hypothetical protein
MGLLALAGALIVSSAVAAPSASCGDMVADLQSYLDKHPDTSGTRRQTKDAQLMHQPTRDSVAKAKKESRDNLVALLGKAKAEQSAGEAAACRATLAEVHRMLTP